MRSRSNEPAPIRTYPSASGRPVLEYAGVVPLLQDGLAELIRYACVRSDSIASATQALGLGSVKELYRLARRYNVKLPWQKRKGHR